MGYYQFWSLDPTYQRIVGLVQERGVPFGAPDLHRDLRLFEGDVYDFGKANGRLYPPGSMVLFPMLHGKEEKPTTSFPATLIITTETPLRLRELEKKFGLENIPKERREPQHPDVAWVA
jgi:hypothetical protein